jgi:hypothetical protein
MAERDTVTVVLGAAEPESAPLHRLAPRRADGIVAGVRHAVSRLVRKSAGSRRWLGREDSNL